jgi:hypothetical protein
MAGGGSSPKGAVGGGGNNFTSDGGGMPPAVGRGHEAGGAKWCSWCACEGRREGEKKWVAGGGGAFYQRSGWQGKERGSRAESAWKREMGGERGA